MQYHKKEGLLALSFFLLSIVLFNGSLSMTGAFIGTLSKIGMNVTALFLFTTSLILFMHTQFDDRHKIEEIVHQFEGGKVNALEAAYSIDEAVHIREVHFKPGFEHSVQGEGQRYSVYVKDEEKGRELAFAEFLLASRRNPFHKSEMHLGKGASTKHHKEGFQILLEHYRKKFQRKYGREFQEQHRASLNELFGL